MREKKLIIAIMIALFFATMVSCSGNAEKKEIANLQNELSQKKDIITKLTDSISDLRRERDSLMVVVFFDNKIR